MGINCIAADDALPRLIGALRKRTTRPLLCKPNAGRAEHGVYPVPEEQFASVLVQCAESGANLLGGCCGTDPGYMQRLAAAIGAPERKA